MGFSSGSKRIALEGKEMKAWIQAARAGNELVLPELCRYFEPLLTRYVHRHTTPRILRWVDASDIVQTVMGNVFGAPARWPEGSSGIDLLRRLRQTAKWRTCDAARRYYYCGGESLLPTGFIAEQSRSRDIGTVTLQDLSTLLRSFLETLPEKYAEIARLRILRGMSYEEIASRTGLETDTVRRRYRRAKEGLERRLRERRHEDE